MKSVAEHFDDVAPMYDFWKQKNTYYYKNLKELYKKLIPPKSVVLEIGCGTGDILASLAPAKGLGIDISAKMIEIAKQKYGDLKNLSFHHTDIYSFSSLAEFEFIFLADVLEHIEQITEFMSYFGRIIEAGTTIIISVANPFWEPIISAGEKVGLKMPEGPHRRLSIKRNELLFLENGFQITKKGFRLLVPIKFPGSDFLNRSFYKNKLFSRFGFIVFWVLKKQLV